MLIIAGWEYDEDHNKANQLKKINVTSTSSEDCTLQHLTAFIDNDVLCAGDSEHKACSFEGGSPLMGVCFKMLFLIYVELY